MILDVLNENGRSIGIESNFSRMGDCDIYDKPTPKTLGTL